MEWMFVSLHTSSDVEVPDPNVIVFGDDVKLDEAMRAESSWD